MTTNPRLILLFSCAFAFFIIAPPFLDTQFPAYPLIHWADVLDIITPLVLIPIYWLLFTDADRTDRPRSLDVAFLVFASLWTLGHGIHLSANSIGNLLGHGDTPVHEIVHFYDEVLSHYLWHIAIIALSVIVLIPPSSRLPQSVPVRWSIVVPSALLYGFTYFAAIIEGGTVAIGLPATIVITGAIIATGRERIRSNSLTALFFFGYSMSLVLFALWFVYWSGFTQFSETGLL